MCTIRVRIGYKEAGVYCRVGNGDSGTSNGINVNLKSQLCTTKTRMLIRSVQSVR